MPDTIEARPNRRRRGPGFLFAAIAVGVAGALAWRNRERIAKVAGPALADARAKGRRFADKAAARGETLIEEAATASHRLVDEAKSKGQALAAKARRVPAEIGPPEVH